MKLDIEQLRSIDSPTVSNAIERLAIRDRTVGYCDLRLRCLFPELGVMVGYALTATVDTTTPGTRTGYGEMSRLFEALEAAPKPAVLVFQEVGPDPLRGCHCGDVMAAVGKALGMVGVVSDAGVRDLDGIRGLGIHCFALGAVVASGTFAVCEVGVPVSVAGLRIHTGDLLHGDANGLLSLPAEVVPQVAEQVARVRERERGMLEAARAPGFRASDLRPFWPTG